MDTNTNTNTDPADPAANSCASCGHKSQDTFCDLCDQDHKAHNDREFDLVDSLELMCQSGHWPDEQPWIL
jgi:hypothetical protein